MKHVNNIKNVYGLPCVVAINAFPTDTKAELDLVEAKCKEVGATLLSLRYGQKAAKVVLSWQKK